MNNAINRIDFPDTLEQGLGIVAGTRIEQYEAAHPSATEEESYQAAMSSIKSAVVPLKIDAVIDGEEKRINVIVSLPTEQQIQLGNEAIEVSVSRCPDEPPVEFDDPVLTAWIADCTNELHDAVFAFLNSQM